MNDVLCKYGLEEFIFRQEKINILRLKQIVFYKIGQMRLELNQSYVPTIKLNTNITLKTMSCITCQKKRSLCALIGGGILPLHTGPGRYKSAKHVTLKK